MAEGQWFPGKKRYGGGFETKEEVEELIHQSLMRARAHLAPGERIPPLDEIEVEIVDGLVDEDTGIEIYGDAYASTLQIRINRQKLTGRDNLENLVYHEFAHLVDEDRGHGERWATAYMGQVEKWMPDQAAFRWDMLGKQYDVDIEAAKAAAFEHGVVPSPTERQALADASVPFDPRHSSGGVVEMEISEFVAALEDQLGRSLTPEEISFVERTNEIRRGALSEADVITIAHEIEQGDPAFGEEVRREARGQSTSEDADRKFQEQGEQVILESDINDALETLSTDPTNPDAIAAIEEARESSEETLLRLMEERARREQQFNYDWVYGGEMQLDMGSLDTTEALMSLKETLEEMGVAEFEEGLEESELEFQIKSLLQRSSQNFEIRTAITQWARETQNYLTPKERSFFSLVNEGLDPAKARTILSVGTQFDISPEELFSIWNNSSRRDEELARIGRIDERVPFSTKKSVFQIARDYKEGLDIYDSSTVLAGIHASDPELAAKLREDPYGLDSGELRRALEVLGQGEGQEGTATGNPQLDWIKTRLAGGFQKPTANVDSGAVAEAVKTLAESWNLVGVEGVTQQTVQDVVAGAVARARANLPNPFAPLEDVRGVDVRDTVQNAEARIRQRLRQTADYQELFEHKGAAESEEEFVSRFERRSQAVLGDDVSSVVRNAMRSGNVNTVFQQGLHTEVGDSSTRFQEILARNAEVFRKML